MMRANHILLVLLWQFIRARGDPVPTTLSVATEITVQTTELDGCVYNEELYPVGVTQMRDDCYEYICQDGDWLNTGRTDLICCFNDMIFERELIYNEHNPGMALNDTTFDFECQTLVCIARNNLTTTGEVYPDCCEYNGRWTPPGFRAYKNDCIEYICREGNWSKSGYNDSYCCENPEWLGGLDGGFRPELELPELTVKRDAEEDNSKHWYGPGEKRTQVNCQEAICISRDQWQLTGDVTSNCSAILQGCEFNGKKYNHTERLPGCIKVYCVKGNWLQSGYIDPECSKCYARLDPHLNTFDGAFYTYSGTGDYALAQEGTTFDPIHGVFNKFRQCWGTVSCVGPSTFKDSPGTIINIGVDGLYLPDIYMLYVNGVAYEIPDNIPRLIKEGSTDHPVFAWRYFNCIRLLGASKLAVQQCHNSVTVWASSEFHNSLNGLCGYFDGNVTNDFTSRDGTEFPLERYPDVARFPGSWLVERNVSSGRRKRNANGDEGGKCTIDSVTDAELTAMCNETIGAAEDGTTLEEQELLMEDCLFDLCSISKNTSGNTGALNSWLENVKSTVEEVSDVANKTTDDDVIPEPLPEEPSTFTTRETTVLTTSTSKETTVSSTSTTEETLPPNEDTTTANPSGSNGKHDKPKCNYGICHLILQVYQEIRYN